MHIEILDRNNEEEWINFINKSNTAGILHTIEWRKILEKEYGFKPFYLMVKKQNEVCGVLPLFQIKSIITGNRLVSLPFSYHCGPIANDDHSIELLIDAGKKQADNLNCKYLELKMLSPLNEKVVNDALLIKNDYFFTSILRLSKDSKENWKKLDPRRTRWAINKAMKSGIEIRSATSTKDLHDFYNLKVATRKKHGSPTPSFKFFRNIMHELHERNMIQLWSAELNGKTIASLMFFTYKDTVMPAYIASDEKYNSYMPSNLLYWKVIEWSCSNGYSYFDFGRTEPANENLLKFKSKWGTENFKIPYYYYPSQPQQMSTSRKGLKYKLFTNIWKKVPLPVAKIFGPILQKQLG